MEKKMKCHVIQSGVQVEQAKKKKGRPNRQVN